MEPPEPASLAGRAMKASLAAAVRTPEAAAQRLFGKPPRNDRGAPLDWQLHILLNVLSAAGTPRFEEVGARKAREIYRRSNGLFDLAPRPLESVEELSIPGPASTLRLRCYRPRKGRLPGCVFYHGGGFVIGSFDGYEGFCSALASGSDCAVLSVEYRLAPECPFPAAVKDAVAAYRWICDNSGSLRLDPDRIAVAGDSAGGNLAAVVCQQQVDDGEETPFHQLLIYPKTDHGEPYESHRSFGEGYLLTRSMIDWFGQCYDAEANDPRCSPIRFERLSELPPATVITAGFDPLRDEGDAYAARLSDAGVPVSHYCCDRLIHGFITMGGIIDRAEAAVADMATEFRRVLHSSTTTESHR